MDRRLLQSAIAAALVSGSFLAVQANAAAAVGHGSGNPLSPAYDHPYRHGVIPTLDVHAAMLRYEQAHPQATNARTLSFGGGVGGVGVMQGQNKVYLVFYGSQWGTASTDANGNLKFTGDSAGAAGAAQQFFKGIGTNNELWQAELTQWCDGTGISSGATSCPSTAGPYNRIAYQSNVLAGVWYDNAAASPAAATGAQLAQEAVRAAAHFGNTATGSNRSTYYVILSPHGTNPDNFQGSYCAWHDYTGDGFGVTAPGGDLAFSNQPYNIDSGAGCGVNFVNSGSAGTLDGYTMTLGHEWHEMMSDQFPSGGWSNHDTGTYAGQENSDECAWIAPGQAGGAAMVSFATGSFAEQASWSNDTSSCAISHPIIITSDAPPVAQFGTTTSGLTATFKDASQDSLGTINRWNWSFGDGTTSTVQNPVHTYAAAGTYSVTETIYDTVNASATTTHSVTVGADTPPVANFSSVVNGLTASFTDSSTDADGTITAHAWNFGDGTTSTATSPTHTYAAAGTYSVTETVTDNGGVTASKTASVSTNPGDAPYLLNNTGFETTGSWTASSGVLCKTGATGCSGQAPHAGTGFAWMGGYGSTHSDTLSQPTSRAVVAGTATLQFYLHVDTAETSTTTAYDKLTVGVYNSSGALLKKLATYSNLNKVAGYQPHSFDMSAFAGQKVTIRFTATEDSSLQTSFVLDDVTFVNY